MIIIAGIINFDQKKSVPEKERDALRPLLSRRNVGESIDFHDENYFISTISFHDINIQQHCCQCTDSITFLAGNPYFENCRKYISTAPNKQVHAMHDLFKTNGWNTLSNNARGVFIAIHYNKKKNQLFLLADKLGVRPLYYWSDDNKIVFSSALRVLDNYPFITRSIDIQGIAESSVFGYPLSRRTLYTEIQRIGAAEIVKFKKGKEQTNRYWDWTSIEEVGTQNIKEKVNNAYLQFRDAVTLRLEGNNAAISFLSGGLDSRCIVTALSDQIHNTYAFNFSPQGSQDRFFAAQLAKILSLNYSEYAFTPGANWSQMMADAWQDKKQILTGSMPKKPWLVWSGDGGSVGAGFVYLDREIAEIGAIGSVDETISAYIKSNGFYFPFRMLTKATKAKVNDFIFSGIKNEMNRLDSTDSMRSLHLFLMENDQRRHLDQHFENLDIHNIDFYLPFFDSFFLENVFALPVSYCLCHKFYMDWFDLFPDIARSTPWQTYPGHKPCSVSFSEDLHYQWASTPVVKDKRQLLKQKEMAQSFISNFLNRSYPTGILNGKALFFAAVLQYFNIRNSQHLFSIANRYTATWKKQCPPKELHS